MKNKNLSKILPFDIFYRPSGQQENWMRIGKYIPEVAPTQEQLDCHAIDYSFLEESLLLREVYKMDSQACLELKEKDPQEYNRKLRFAKKTRNFSVMYGGGK